MDTPTLDHPDHLSDAELIDWWLHDSDAAATDAMDEHLMHCDACGARADRWIALGAGVRGAFCAGAVSAMLSEPFLQRLRAAGLRVREYAPPAGGSVNCSVAPDDDLLVSRLRVPLQGVQRVDAVATFSFLPGHVERLHDVPFDAERGELLFTPRTAEAKLAPAHTFEVTLLAVDAAAGERELARFRFHHSPWAPGVR